MNKLFFYIVIRCRQFYFNINYIRILGVILGRGITFSPITHQYYCLFPLYSLYYGSSVKIQLKILIYHNVLKFQGIKWVGSYTNLPTQRVVTLVKVTREQNVLIFFYDTPRFPSKFLLLRLRTDTD